MSSTSNPCLEPASFDECIKAVYSASAGAIPWGNALESIALLFGGRTSHAMGVNPKSRAMEFIHEGGAIQPQATFEYVSKWHKVDPRAAHVMAAPPGQWIHCHEVFDEEYVAVCPFYRDFLIPYGMRYFSNVRYVVSPDLWVLFSVTRGVGCTPLNETERETLRRLGKHLEAAMSLLTTAKMAAQAAFAGYAMLRKLHYPIVVMTEDRRVLFSNDAAAQLEAKGLVLMTGGRLVLRDTAENADLTIGMKHTQLSAALMQTPVKNCRPPSLVRCGRSLRDDSALIHLSLIEPADCMGAFGSATTFVVTIFVGNDGIQLDAFVVSYAYNLPPAESRVAVGIAEGSTVEAIAQKQGTSVLTVRTQLKSALAKIGVRRQVELTRLLSSNPVFRLSENFRKRRPSM